MDLHGTVHGSSIQVEEPLPGLDGKRVKLRVEIVDETDARLSSEENGSAWDAWAKAGPQGPIEDDDSDWT